MKILFTISTSFLLMLGCQPSEEKQNIQDDHFAKSDSASRPTITAEELEANNEISEKFLDATLLRYNFNGAILIAKNGVPVYERYIGFRDMRTKDSLTAETPLQIASTSKPFTAAAVLKLVQEGKLDLNAQLEHLFPDFPYPGITVKMLLNHRSGLPNYLYFMENGGWERRKLATNADVLDALYTMKPAKAYRPGVRFNYCNTNYVLLALIIEKLTGQSYADYMRINFFEPLKMNNTYVLTINDSSRITPSFDGYGRPWALDFSDGPYGDKNIYSTPRDLLKWDQAWYGNALLQQPLIDSAFTSYSHERRSIHNYGLGWRLLELPNEKKVIYHNGRWHGFNSAFARLTDEKVTIIILTNKFNRNVYPIARKMYNVFGNYDGKNDEAEE